MREPIREVCRQPGAMIRREPISSDHVHLLVSIPPPVTIRRLVQRLEGKSSPHLLAEFAPLRKGFWGRHVWARGYFCCRNGNVTDEMSKKYIEEQNQDKDDDFKVEEIE